MLVDLLSGDREMMAETDVCIVGGGAAGVTLARALKRAGRKICLLESGGMDFEPRTQALYQGESTGMEYYPLDHSRLRFFGGTTNIWGGRCLPLDRLDFERRDWVPHSGWPISREDLDPFYREAHEGFEVGEFDYTAKQWEKLEDEGIPFDPEEIETRFWRFDLRKERFNSSQCDDLAAAEKVTVYLHANLTHIQLDQPGGQVQSVEAGSLEGHRLRVRAKEYVLACGGIENARLLLNADDIHPNGIGNEHDQVGRYFMEHPHGRLGHVACDDPAAIWIRYRKRYPSGGTPVAPALTSSEALQRRTGALNIGTTFKLQRPSTKGLSAGRKVSLNLRDSLKPSRSGRQYWHLYRSARAFLQRNVPMSLVKWRARLRKLDLYLIARAEQSPNPESRVQLSDRRDSLGLRRVDLHWQLSDLDKHSAREHTLALKREFGRLGLGEVTPGNWLDEDSPEWPVDPNVGNHPIAGYHHMGTTRMSANPKHGVVDAHGTVHGVENLHITGSSVFATSGWANPTLTILALTRRLARHLDKRLK